MSKNRAPKSAHLGAPVKPCEKCKPQILEYVDELSDINHDLIAIANLCRGITNTEFIDEGTLIQLGNIIEHHLNKQNILKHFFFGEPLGDSIDESVIAGELHRLKYKADAMRKEGETENKGSQNSDK